jgi:hypothetical protein
MPTRDSLTLRASKGSGLSFGEMDSNFTTLADAIDAGGGGTPVNIYETTTVASTSQTQVAAFNASTFRSGKLIVQVHDTVTGEVQISELLVVHNGSIASSTEYGVVYSGSTSLVLFDVDIVSNNVRLLATRSTSNSTQYKTSKVLITT